MTTTTLLTPLASGLCAWPGDYCANRANPVFCLDHRQTIPHEWLTRPEDGPLDTPCWLFLGVLVRGYGRVRVGTGVIGAHRFMWERANGSIPDGLCVLHRCDVPACVNPDHLWLGTNADNMADCVAKGRQARGERHGRSKLTEADVRAIRAAVARGEFHGRIAARFGVGNQLVSRIATGRSWAHVK